MNYFENTIKDLKEKNQYRFDFMDISSEQTKSATIKNTEMLLFGSNNYLNLSSDNRLKEASIKATKKYGVGAGGSRLTTGSYDIITELEKELASFKGYESALVFTSGYTANLGVISAICNKEWVIFCDKNNHASIYDACLLSGAKLVRYKTCDVNDLEKKIKKFKSKNNIIITDAVFSMQGNLAPLKEIAEIAKEYDIYTLVDDAHGFGVLGELGRGSTNQLNVKNIDIIIGTLSKAAGSVGGYVVSNKTIIDFIRNKARSFIYTTALPPSTYAVSLEAIELIKESNDKRKHLKEICKYFIKELKKLNLNVKDTDTSIIALVYGDELSTLKVSATLLKEGIYVPAIRPPTVKRGESMLRFTLTCEHNYKDINKVLDVLKSLKYE